MCAPARVLDDSPPRNVEHTPDPASSTSPTCSRYDADTTNRPPLQCPFPSFERFGSSSAPIRIQLARCSLPRSCMRDGQCVSHTTSTAWWLARGHQRCWSDVMELQHC